MSQLSRRGLPAALAAALLAACAGNGAGLDANGQPLGSGNASPPPLAADFQSLQDNVFTPICVRCHSGAAAPQGLELDSAHSYALLVGVASSEVPALERVKPGAPDSSYLVLKLEGAAGIVGAQMPLGGPPLPQSTIDFIRQWITDGAPESAAARAAANARTFSVSAFSPRDAAVVAAPLRQIVVAFNHEVDAALVNYTTLHLERLTAGSAQAAIEPLSLGFAAGNPRVVLLTPAAALGAGRYRLSVRGSGAAALADLGAQTLDRDYTLEFTVEDTPR